MVICKTCKFHVSKIVESIIPLINPLECNNPNVDSPIMSPCYYYIDHRDELDKIKSNHPNKNGNCPFFEKISLFSRIFNTLSDY